MCMSFNHKRWKIKLDLPCTMLSEEKLGQLMTTNIQSSPLNMKRTGPLKIKWLAIKPTKWIKGTKMAFMD